MRVTSPVYLHFLDRELNQAAGTILQSSEVLQTLEVLILSCDADFYCGLSLVLEHPSIDATVRELIEGLVASDQLGLVSHHADEGEFIQSRQRLYGHDRDRYPAYFRNPASGLRSTDFKPESTTEALRDQLLQSVETTTSSLSLQAREALGSALDRREGEAITAALFSPFLDPTDFATRFEIATEISLQYTSHYTDFLGGEVPTGVRGLSRFDHLASEFPSADVPVGRYVLKQLGLSPLLDRTLPGSADEWQRLTADGEVRRTIAAPVAAIVQAAGEAAQAKSADRASRMRIRHVVDQWFSSLRRRRAQQTTTTGVVLDAALIANEILAHLERNQLWSSSVTDSSKSDVTVVVTATDSEARALENTFVAAGKSIVHHVGPGMLSHFEVNSWRRTRVLWVRCRPGSGTRGGSQDVVREAVAAFRPSRVIMVGIAFGVDEVRQPIGSVLVADKVVNYEFVRHGTDPIDSTRALIRDRSETGEADIGLVEAFRDIGWKSPGRTEVGLVLSGPELVDNVTRRDHLVASQVGAVGGEMEGYGVYVACHRHTVPWVLVKAVCDWGDGSKGTDKEARQAEAASAAADRLVTYLSGG